MVLVREKTASFDVDAQKGFSMHCPDELPVLGGEGIVDALNRQARFAGWRVGSKDAHPANPVWKADERKPQFSPLGAPNADIHWNLHCVVGTRGHQLLDGLPASSEYSFFVQKGMEPDMHPYGACYHDLADRQSTGVIEFLKFNGVTTVIVGGLATDYCVATTAIQLSKAGFTVIVNLEACRGIAAESVEAAIGRMRDSGILVLESLEGLEQIGLMR